MSKLKLEKLDISHLDRLFQFELDNREFFKKNSLGRKNIYYIREQFDLIYDEFLKDMDIDSFYMYLLLDNNKIIGRFNLVDIDRFNNTGEIGYRMDESSQGKGYATEGVRLLIEKSKVIHSLDRLIATTLLDNKASQKVLLKNGFKELGVEKDSIKVDGRYYDALLFELYIGE